MLWIRHLNWFTFGEKAIAFVQVESFTVPFILVVNHHCLNCLLLTGFGLYKKQHIWGPMALSDLDQGIMQVHLGPLLPIHLQQETFG